MGTNSFVLFARPSFVEGVARAMDLAGGLNEYNSCRSPEEADALAMATDYAALIGDMRAAWNRLQLQDGSRTSTAPEPGDVAATA